VRALAAERGVELRFRAQTVPPIAGNEESLERLLLNLLENAIKYNREGGNVEVGLTTNGDELVLEVADSGIGVPRGDLRRIFERFYRVDAGRSREEGGTGLGMAIVKHAAQLRGGRVEVSSELGRGSVFRVLLPVTRS
jgi:two-component system phosphate regulon sensor histidine kinase PhoR